MNIKRLFMLLSFMAASLMPMKAEKVEITMLENEKWWGSVTDLGNIMPFDSETEIRFNHQTQNFNNQTTPLLVSNKGRYIWSDSPFKAEIKDGKISLDAARGTIECVQAGTNLREAFLAAAKAHFPASGTVPPDLFFNVPQYNTWIELIYNQNQADILKYAHSIVDNGFPTGILMIDDNWQKYYGNFEFSPDRFPDPKGMVKELHEMGFKVMLWVSPFVSPDSQEYRWLRDKGYLVMNADGSRPTRSTFRCHVFLYSRNNKDQRVDIQKLQDKNICR